jgi:integrase
MKIKFVTRGGGNMNKRHNSEGSFKLRNDGRWEGKVWIDGVRKSAYGKTRKEAANKISTMIKNHRNGVTEDVKLTLGAWIERWMTECKNDIKPKTRDSYNQVIKLYLIPSMGRVIVADLTPVQVQTALNAMTKSGLSGRTVAYTRTILRSALKQAMRWGLVSRNVAELVTVPSHTRDIPEPWTKEEIKSFMNASQNHPQGRLFQVAVHSGLRQGELLGLRWSDVNLEAGTIHVRSTLDKRDGEWLFPAPKSEKSVRTVPLTKDALRALSAQRNQQWEDKVGAYIWRDYDIVFHSAIGTPLDAGNVRRAAYSLMKSTDLPHQRFHDFRHACASMLASAGVSLFEASRWLGHSQISITADLYSHLFEDSLSDAADKLQQAMSA